MSDLAPRRVRHFPSQKETRTMTFHRGWSDEHHQGVSVLDVQARDEYDEDEEAWEGDDLEEDWDEDSEDWDEDEEDSEDWDDEDDEDWDDYADEEEDDDF